MKIASWNVNSLKVRLPQVLEWLAAHPEVSALCLQETKLEDHNFPRAEIEQAGLHVAYAGQKTYNGVAILARAPLTDITVNIPGLEDTQKRLIAATLGDIRPNTRLLVTILDPADSPDELVHTMMVASAASLARVWDNDDDAVYDTY